MTIKSIYRDFCSETGLAYNTFETVIKSGACSFVAVWVRTQNSQLALGIGVAAMGASLVHSIGCTLLNKVGGYRKLPEWGKLALMGANIIAIVPLFSSSAHRINVVFSCSLTTTNFYVSKERGTESRRSTAYNSSYIFV